MKMRCLVACVALLLGVVDENVAAGPAEPLVRVADLNVGETATVMLADGKSATIRVVALDEQDDPIRHAVRQARVMLEIDGQRAEIVAGPYRLPMRIGTLQIDCPATKGLNRNGTPAFWGLDKDVRLRLWPENSAWITPGTFRYPVKQRWFATYTQMSNEPTYVDGDERLDRPKIYYHSGLDIGGSEGQVEVVAATDGLVVSVGTDVLPEHRQDTPIAARYDVIYLLDARGWYYRYSHLKEFDPQILPGRQVKIGQRLGLLGKEGASGGWSHLHFEMKSRQPSGKWGTQDGYAFLWQAYCDEHQPRLIAVARPHHLIRTGDSVELDGSRSWSADGKVATFRWTLSDGSTAATDRVTRAYAKPGVYSEVLEIRDAAGRVDYDSNVVQVLDPAHPEQLPPTIHAAYYPTDGIRPDDPVTFKARTFRTTDGEETWDFGDGSPPAKTRSDGNVKPLAPEGYAVLTHRFARPGHYIVRVERTNASGLTATGHLHVTVEPAGQETGATNSPRPKLRIVDEQGTEHDVSDADLAKLPRIKATVTGRDDRPAEYEGVRLADLLQAQGIVLGKQLHGPRIASYLLLDAEDGYQVVLAIGEVDPATTDKVVLLADKKNGAALPDKEGPWRIVIPDEKRPVRWIRMLKRITVKSAITPQGPK